MPTFVSPGVYVIEKDLSDFAAVPESSVVGIVGFATKGPVNEPTLITSPQNLIDTFGKPSEDIPGQGLIGAIEILEATNNIYYVRAAVGSTAVDASTLVNFGSAPAVKLDNSGVGVTLNGGFKVQLYNNQGVAQFSTLKSFSIASGTAGAGLGNASGQALAVAQSVGAGSLDSAKVGLFNDANGDHWLVGAYAGSGAYMEVSAFTDGNFTLGRAMLFAVNNSGNTGTSPTSAVTASGLTLFPATVASGLGYLVQSIHPGSGYNLSTLSDGSIQGNSIEVDNLGGERSLITVNDGGAAAENYKISLLDGFGTFIEDVIQTDTTTEESDFIYGNLVSGLFNAITPTKLTFFSDKLNTLGVTNIAGNYGGSVLSANPRFIKPIENSYGLGNGTDGTGTSTQNHTALIGDSTASPKTGIHALDDDLLNISVACIPGFYDQNVQNAFITLGETSQNFMPLIAVPYGIGNVQNAIDWHNGLDVSRTAAITSDYAAIYFPHVKVFSQFDGVDRWYDPVIFAARQIAFTDAVSEAWFAPAGQTRGRLPKPTQVEVKINQGDRDSMYSGGNVINPIVGFPQQGIMIFGQRTAKRTPSALDRINVRRLMILLRKIILASTRQFVFEPNDQVTWERVESLLNPLLDDIRARRGITDFRVICDETTNTPVRVDRNELWCKVLLKPTKTAEIIIFELNLTSQSAKLGG